jgi:hypothetical protein
MSGSGRNTAAVFRNYQSEPGAMADAISLLLRMPCKERAAEDTPEPGGRDDIERASEYVATENHTK